MSRFRVVALALVALALVALLVPAVSTPVASAASVVSLLIKDRAVPGTRGTVESYAGREVEPLGLGWVRVELPASVAGRVVADVRARGGVAEPDGRVEAQRRTPSDPWWPDQWGPAMVGAPHLWAVSPGARATTIAVLDTGVDETADLQGALRRGRNFVATESSESSDWAPDKHGTNVALVAAARANDGVGIAGYCWRCRVLPVRVLDPAGIGSVGDIVAGIEWAVDNGADVLNLSLGASRKYQALEEAVAYARHHGVIVTAAAGNLGGTARMWPAAYPDVVGVAAVDESGRLAPFSNRGSWVEVAAPSCHITRSRIREFCGTSSSAPAVAGAVGAALSSPRDLRPNAVTGRLLRTAAQLEDIRHGSMDLLGFATGLGEGQPVVGDWNGDGRSTPGLFRNGSWHLSDALRAGADKFVSYGRAGDVPVVGDWNGDGRDTIGIVRDGTWHLRNHLSGGRADRSFRYGRVGRGDHALTGDWNGDGRDTIGIVRDREWHLKHSLSGGRADHSFIYGRVTRGDVPLIGDWNRDGRDTVGIVRGGIWHLRDDLAGGAADRSFRY
jgi:hypothetical protein